jgi:hypothetical protein
VGCELWVLGWRRDIEISGGETKAGDEDESDFCSR